MRTRLLFVLMLTAVAVCATAAENKGEVNGSPNTPPPINQETPEIKPLKPFNSQGLELTFALDGTQFASGEPVRGHFTLKCVGNESFPIYNAFFHGKRTMPGDVRVFDKAGKLVSKLLEYREGSWIGVDEELRVSPGDLVGSQIIVKPCSDYDRGTPLPPGEYKAQFVLLSYVVHGIAPAGINPCPPGCGYTYDEFAAGKAVIAATKPIPFKIVPK